ncbi:MAG TPA: 3D domain-containing protein [Vicinamibacterales bacterium]|nr:3D domain-containing protein [Vicinamibacterales bacterium]
MMAALAVFLLYEASVIDSRSVGSAGLADAGLPVQPGARMVFEATAYCKGHTTKSGVPVRAGIAAADPKVLPLGSVIQLGGVPDAYKGIYTVLDTGPKIQGRILDIYIWSCHEALAFGRRRVEVTILRMGWNQQATAGQARQ